MFDELKEVKSTLKKSQISRVLKYKVLHKNAPENAEIFTK